MQSPRARARGVAQRVRSLVLACCAAIALGGACGGDDDGGGSAGSGPMTTPTLGELCTGECTAGSTCGTTGLFPGQCSTLCSGVASCTMLAISKTTACFAMKECGIVCNSDVACPAGTHCAPVGGQMGCIKK